MLNKKIIMGTIIVSSLLSACQSNPAHSNKSNKKNNTPTSSPTQLSGSNLEKNQNVQSFIKMMVSKHQFNEAALQKIFAHTRKQQAIIDAMNKPAEKSKTWGEYRPIFMTEKRINEGARFYTQHSDVLKRAEAQFGVNAEIIVAIIGVETSFGANKGKWRVMDALSTLAFHFPRRAEFFTQELEKFLLIARDNQADPFSFTGSYAGAMGYPQFMPSSYRNFAVDFDGDGKRDLWNNPVDAIGSVANYLAKNGWSRGGTIAIPVTIAANKDISRVVHNGSVTPPTQLVKNLILSGVITTANPNSKAMLLQFENTTATEYWLTFQNFYSITRYNRSPLYALAVYQLGQAIKQKI